MRWAVPVAGLLLLLFAASAQAAVTHVHVAGSAFDPAAAAIAVGDTVVWHNHDAFAHTVTSDDGRFTSSGNLGTGASYSFTFTTAGTYAYHCAIHPTMRGSVAVAGDGNAPPQISIASPAEGERVSGVVNVTGSASDADGDPITIEVQVDGGAWRAATGGGAWAFAWDASGAAAGEHTLRARASDGNHTTESAPRKVVVGAGGGGQDAGGANGTGGGEGGGIPLPALLAAGALAGAALRKYR